MNEKQAAIAAKEYMFEKRLENETTRDIFLEALEEASLDPENFDGFNRDQVAQNSFVIQVQLGLIYQKKIK